MRPLISKKSFNKPQYYAYNCEYFIEVQGSLWLFGGNGVSICSYLSRKMIEIKRKTPKNQLKFNFCNCWKNAINQGMFSKCIHISCEWSPVMIGNPTSRTTIDFLKQIALTIHKKLILFNVFELGLLGCLFVCDKLNHVSSIVGYYGLASTKFMLF